MFLDLKLFAKNNPEQLLKEKELKKMEKKDIEMVVRKGTKVEYASPSLDKQALVQSLPGFEETNINTRDTIKINDYFLLM